MSTSPPSNPDKPPEIMTHRSSTIFQFLLAAAIYVAIGLLSPAPAQAITSEGQWWTGVGAANLNEAAPSAFGWWGPSLETGVVFDVHDFWRLTADAGVSHHFRRTIDDEPAGPHTVVSTALGVRYTFDVVQYVPYAGLAFAAHPLGAPSSGAPDGELFSVRGTIGLDYRQSRRYSFGSAIDLHAPLSQPTDFPHYSSIRVHLGVHFRRF